MDSVTIRARILNLQASPEGKCRGGVRGYLLEKKSPESDTVSNVRAKYTYVDKYRLGVKVQVGIAIWAHVVGF